MKKMNANALLAGVRSNTLIAGLFILLIVSMVLLFVNFAYINTQADYDNEYVGHAGELRVLSQRIAKNAVEAATGTAEAFDSLKDARNDFSERWSYLSVGDERIGLPAVPEVAAV
jgi:twitching motility protein PilJ